MELVCKMVWQFIEVFKRIRTDQIKDDDYADRLSHRHTVILLIVFTLLVGSTQFVGSPIACWTPAHFTGSMNQYTNYICWIANTYYVPTSETLPNPNEPRQYRINYYQWIPFILALMAVLFYSPWAIWHTLSRSSSLDAKGIMKIVQTMDHTNAETREKSIRTIVRLVDRSVDNTRDWYDYTFCGRMRRMLNRCFLPIYKRNGSYICTIYMLTKLMYLANVCGQFFLLNAFMGPDFNIYGFQVLRDLFKGKDFWESPRFPRVTMCDFTIRTLGENNHRNTIQCTLPINLYNEKIFMFLWFWLVLVAFLTAYNFVVWLVNFTNASRTSFVRRYLHMNERFRSLTETEANVDTKGFDRFVRDYLKQDGVFLLRIIKKNTNDLVTGELICALWDKYRQYPKFMKDRSDKNEKNVILKDNEKLNGDSMNNYN